MSVWVSQHNPIVRMLAETFQLTTMEGPEHH